MKKIFSYSILLLLPFFFIIISLYCKESVGEYWASRFYDPAYAYLISSLNLAQLSGYGIEHIDHPGTPIQVTGAVVIKFFYAIAGEDTDIVKDVFLRPEFYLSRINLTFVLLTAFALFILGLIVYKKQKNIYAALLLQLTPFYTSTIYDHFTDVSSESLLIFSIIVLIMVLMSFISSKTITRRIYFYYTIGFGIICGFSLACKLLLFPILIIPFILLKKFSFKALFILVTLISFLIFVYPAMSNVNSMKFLNWYTNVVTHSGYYGDGPEAVIEPSKYLGNLGKFFLYKPMFDFAYFLTAFTLILSFNKKFKKIRKEEKYYGLLLGIFIMMTIYIVVIPKHFEYHYMITPHMFSVLALFIVNHFAIGLFPALFKRKKLFYVSIIIIIFCISQLIIVREDYTMYAHRQDETRKFINYSEKTFEYCLTVNSNLNTKMYSLLFGVEYSGEEHIYRRYISILKNLYPDYIFFNKWSKDIDPGDIQNFQSKLKNCNNILFRSEDEDLINNFISRIKQLTNKENVNYKKVFSNDNFENIYEITF